MRTHRNIDDALVAGEAFLQMAGLVIVTADEEILYLALDLIRRYHLAPRDAIHAAAVLTVKATLLVSTDEHFDAITEMKRKPL